jgi:hypothetical protein
VLSGLVVAALPGCSDGKTDAQPETTTLLVQAPPGADAPSQYPIGQEWRRGTTWSHALDYFQGAYDLWQNGIAICMRSRGFDYQPQPFVDDTVVNIFLNPLNETYLSSGGYHGPKLPADLNEARARDEKYSLALNTDEGCGAKAYKYAYGFPESSEYFDSIQTLVNQIEEEFFVVVDRAEYLELVAQWSKCMKESGYQYSARQDISTAFEGQPTVTDDEIRVRKADFTCDEQVGLTKYRSEEEARIRAAAIDRRAPQIDELERQRRAVVIMLQERQERLVEVGVAALDE